MPTIGENSRIRWGMTLVDLQSQTAGQTQEAVHDLDAKGECSCQESGGWKNNTSELL